MSIMREKLLPHRGHHIACVCYGDWSVPNDVCIECEDCNTVLISAEDYDMPDSYPVDCESMPEFIGQIIDIFEDFLEEKDILIENAEKADASLAEEDLETSAIISGSDYDALQRSLESMMMSWRILKGGRK